jgi:uncharacterized coiled-coil DUF342 family protein
MFFTRKDRTIANQKVMIVNRDRLIRDMEDQATSLYNDKKRLNIEIEELKEFKEEVINIMNEKDTIVNKYDKIKELISDDQSQN